MKKYGSHQFAKLEGRNHEAAMLAQRAQLRLTEFPDVIQRHGFPVSGHVLDIGTAQGIRARLMAENYPSAHIIGIDRSQELLAEAITNNNTLPNLEFRVGNVYSLPFADNTFDFVYARLVFMHLSDPVHALNEIKRVLKIGGRLLIEDADRDCMFFEPAPTSFADFWKLVQDGQRRLGGDPNIGRKLATLLNQSGLQKIQTEIQTIQGDGSDIEFLVQTLMPSLNIYLDSKDRSNGQRAINDLFELSKNQFARFYHFWFMVSGEKS